MEQSMYRFAVCVVALSVSAAPSFAHDKKSVDPDKKICRSEGPVTGSIMGGKRVCHTSAEWSAIDDGNRRNTDALLHRPVVGGQPR